MYNKCRTCLGEYGEVLENINSQISINGKIFTYLDLLGQCFNYKISRDDHLPKSICLGCAARITATYSFKNLIQTSLQVLCNQSCYSNTNFRNIDEEDCTSSSDLTLPIDKNKSGNQPVCGSESVKIKDNIINKLLYCSYCKDTFETKQKIKDHCLNVCKVNNTVGRPCDICSECFVDFKSLLIHRKQHFSPYLCHICWSGFNSKYLLDEHSCKKNETEKQLETNNECKIPKPQCHICGKSYQKDYISKHIRLHGDDKCYSCKYCSLKFKISGALHSHILWKHIRHRTHHCTECGMDFITASAKSTHYRKLHLKEKNHFCKYCGRKYFSRSELNRHILTHTGVKNFHCSHCEKSYQTRYGLNVHLKSHKRTPN